MPLGSTRRSIPHGRTRTIPDGMPVQGNLDPLALVSGRRGARGDASRSASSAALAERPHVFNLGHGILQDTPIAHVEALISRVRGGWARIILERLAMAYQWFLAAHIIFVVFWMAGLFMMPRYLVYHQEALAAGRDRGGRALGGARGQAASPSS